MLELLEQLYLHRIAHLNKFAIRQAVIQVNPDYSIPTKQEISAYMSGQLSLFPKGSGMTLIQWQRDKVAFIETGAFKLERSAEYFKPYQWHKSKIQGCLHSKRNKLPLKTRFEISNLFL